jgi:RHS repeat-associated protein
MGTTIGNGTIYLIADHLGSTRLVTQGDATVLSRHDYLPFGEEITVGRSADPAYGLTESVDGVNQRFTGKERDAETSLDYFKTRYMANTLGRFTSPDAVFAGQHMRDPQSWNMYVYGRNNPHRFVDPSGRCDKSVTDEGRACFDIDVPTSGIGKVLTAIGRFFRGLFNSTVDNALVLAENGSSEMARMGGLSTLPKLHPTPPSTNAELFGHLAGMVGPMAAGPLMGAADAAGGLGDIAELSEEAEYVNLADDQATIHILYSDETGGGHLPGLGIKGKSEFPAGWSTDEIMHNISDVATDPASTVTKVGPKEIIDGTRKGVDIRVIVKDGRIVTGYPTNLPRN